MSFWYLQIFQKIHEIFSRISSLEILEKICGSLGRFEDTKRTFQNLLTLPIAMASVTAGFKWPPVTPPETKMPSMTAMPKPQLMLKKSPEAPLLSTDWATDASPNTYMNTEVNHSVLV